MFINAADLKIKRYVYSEFCFYYNVIINLAKNLL